MEFQEYLKTMAIKDASDLYLSTGAPPCIKIDGVLRAIGKEVLPPGGVKEIADAIMDSTQQADFGEKPEMNLALSEPGIGRFRVNIFKQRNEVAMVVRNIKMEIPDMKSLGLPPVLAKIIMAKRGLVLFVGATGSGKSTSLASLIDYRNHNASGHIITIEDPIEFVHKHRKSIVNQREIGMDTDSYSDALKSALRQAPDVILIGEIRDQETMEHAVTFAETGHLAISTLHANNSNQALDRIINFFPQDRHNQLLLDLSLNMRAIISQRLIATVDGKRAAAIEVLLGTPLVRDMIQRGEIDGLKEIMKKSEHQGMQTFDSDLLKLFQQGRISEEEALRNADSQNNLRLRIKAMTNDGAGEVATALELVSDDPPEEKDDFSVLEPNESGASN
jgi:twitching motility protein PilU